MIRHCYIVNRSKDTLPPIIQLITYHLSLIMDHLQLTTYTCIHSSFIFNHLICSTPTEGLYALDIPQIDTRTWRLINPLAETPG